jgi:acetate---CoA ligase (ADP-forming) subunit beta
MSAVEQKMMPEPEAIDLIGEYGLPYPEHRLVRSAAEAAEFAVQIGGPVVLKIVSPQVPHKSDAGGVMTGLAGAEAAAQGYEELLTQVKESVPGAKISGVLACREAEPGLEVIIGGLRDRTFGPTVMFGLGGVLTEVLRDVAFRIAPLERIDAEEMIDEVKGRALLDGYRGQAAADRSSLADALQAVGRLMLEREEVAELDLNPIRLYPDGLLTLDARVIARQKG